MLSYNAEKDGKTFRST